MKTKDLKETFMNVTQAKWVRSTWGKGVQDYALELLEQLCDNYKETNKAVLKEQLLNGATTFTEYSWNGCSLIYNEDIAQRLATKSEIKKRTYKNEQLSSYANKKEQWLDVQSRALFQAYRRIKEVLKTWENE